MRRITSFVLSILELLLRDCTYTMRTGLAKGLRRRYGFGSKPKFRLTEEERFLAGLDLRGRTVFDVGAYVGIYTMFFARAVGADGEVVAFEPNPRNCEELIQNVRLNGFDNVTVLPIGLGDQHRWMNLIQSSIYPSRGSFRQDEAFAEPRWA